MKNKLGFTAIAVIVIGLIAFSGSNAPRAAEPITEAEIEAQIPGGLLDIPHPVPQETLDLIDSEYANWQPKVKATNIGEPLPE